MAEEAVHIGDIDASEVSARLESAEQAVAAADDADKDKAEAERRIAEAMVAAAASA